MSTQHQYSLTGNAAELYEKNLVPTTFARFARGLLEFAQLQSGEHVLDVACGTGIVARLAWPQVAPSGRVVGLDVNAAMLNVPRSAAEAAGTAIEWQESDAASMQLADATFDAVLCQLGLQYFADKHAALMEMHRVLRDSGRLMLSVFRSIEHNPSHAVLAAAAGRRAPFALSDRDEIRSFVYGAGFQDVMIRLDVHVVRFPSAEAMIRIMMAGTPLAATMAEVDPAVLQTVIAEVTSGLAAYEEDEGLALPMQKWVVTAKA